jgi:peptidoglycan/xylan/chitin deacetylase (PgdA/CDA1 family)
VYYQGLLGGIALQLKNRERTEQPVEQRQQRRMYVVRWGILVALGVFLLGGVLISLAAINKWAVPFVPVSHVQTSSNSQVSSQIVQPHLIETLTTPISPVAHEFMGAMMRKDWKTMWSLLHPDAQKSWQGEGDFLHFEQAKFGSITFVSYSQSPLKIMSSWRDPDTTQIYSHAAILSVSLQATARQNILSGPSNLALKQGLFDHTLFALAQNHGLWQVLVAGPADPQAPVLVPARPPALKLRVPIFMYHHVSRRPTHDLLDYTLTVNTTDFNQQLTWLSQHGYHSITQTDLFDAFYYGKALPAHPMMLTFDDGYEDVYTDALPVLLAQHDRGVFYIITGMIAGNYLTWEQIHILAQDGMQLASHTVHHVNVGQPPAGTSTQTELLLSKQTLQRQLDEPIQFFCYPSGEPFHHDTVAQQQMVLADLFKDGYVSATLDPFSIDSAVQNAQTPYQLNRIRVSGGEDLEAFIGILEATLSKNE